MSQNTEITMKDVETAIKVLNVFIRRSREAEMLMRHVQGATGSGMKMPSSMQDFISMAYQMKQGQQGQPETQKEPEPLTEEEVRRIREIKEKHLSNP